MNETHAIDRMRQVIRLQLEELATEDAYVLGLRCYIKALRQMPPSSPVRRNCLPAARTRLSTGWE